MAFKIDLIRKKKKLKIKYRITVYINIITNKL